MYIARVLHETADVDYGSIEGRGDYSPTLEEMQGAVGGLIDMAFCIPSHERETVTIDFYVNEEGLMIGLPIVLGINTRPGYVMPVAGNILICGSVDATGESVSLTMEEIEWAARFIQTVTPGIHF